MKVNARASRQKGVNPPEEGVVDDPASLFLGKDSVLRVQNRLFPIGFHNEERRLQDNLNYHEYSQGLVLRLSRWAGIRYPERVHGYTSQEI